MALDMPTTRIICLCAGTMEKLPERAILLKWYKNFKLIFRKVKIFTFPRTRWQSLNSALERKAEVSIPECGCTHMDEGDDAVLCENLKQFELKFHLHNNIRFNIRHQQRIK